MFFAVEYGNVPDYLCIHKSDKVRVFTSASLSLVELLNRLGSKVIDSTVAHLDSWSFNVVVSRIRKVFLRRVKFSEP